MRLLQDHEITEIAETICGPTCPSYAYRLALEVGRKVQETIRQKDEIIELAESDDDIDLVDDDEELRDI